jgi:ABC-type transport system substrate-binding protein
LRTPPSLDDGWAQRNGAAQSTPASPRRLVIAIGQSITNIVPTLNRSAAAMQISDLVFLRLGRYGGTSFGDHAAVPELAKGWTRRDSLTIAFDLDPRARWHDGTAVHGT